MQNYIKLIESAQSENTMVVESFKDAQRVFSDSSDATEVTQYIAQFKELANRNIVKGPDKDIGKWIKAGWDEFKSFVDANSHKSTKRQMKTQVKSESITIYEDEKVMLVIPLSEKASCFYGKSTKWCTAATETDNHFVEYFSENDITLVYALFKNGNKHALALHGDVDTVEAFDAEDVSISPGDFEEAVGVSIVEIHKAVEKVSPVIEKAREKLTPKYQMMGLVSEYKGGNGEVVLEMIEAIEEYYEGENVETMMYVERKGGGLGVMFDLDDVRRDRDFDYAVNSLDEILDIDVETTDAHDIFVRDAHSVYHRLVAQHILNTHGESSYQDSELNEWSVEDVVDDMGDILEFVDDDDLDRALVLAYSDALRFDVEKQLVESLNSHCERIAADLHFSMPENSGYAENWYFYFADHRTVDIRPEGIDGHIEHMLDIGGDIQGEYSFTPTRIDPSSDDDEYNQQLEAMLISEGIDTVSEYVKRREAEEEKEGK